MLRVISGLGLAYIPVHLEWYCECHATLNAKVQLFTETVGHLRIPTTAVDLCNLGLTFGNPLFCRCMYTAFNWSTEPDTGLITHSTELTLTFADKCPNSTGSS